MSSWRSHGTFKRRQNSKSASWGRSSDGVSCTGQGMPIIQGNVSFESGGRVGAMASNEICLRRLAGCGFGTGGGSTGRGAGVVGGRTGGIVEDGLGFGSVLFTRGCFCTNASSGGSASRQKSASCWHAEQRRKGGCSHNERGRSLASRWQRCVGHWWEGAMPQ